MGGNKKNPLSRFASRVRGVFVKSRSGSFARDGSSAGYENTKKLKAYFHKDCGFSKKDATDFALQTSLYAISFDNFKKFLSNAKLGSKENKRNFIRVLNGHKFGKLNASHAFTKQIDQDNDHINLMMAMYGRIDNSLSELLSAKYVADVIGVISSMGKIVNENINLEPWENPFEKIKSLGQDMDFADRYTAFASLYGGAALLGFDNFSKQILIQNRSSASFAEAVSPEYRRARFVGSPRDSDNLSKTFDPSSFSRKSIHGLKGVAGDGHESLVSNKTATTPNRLYSGFGDKNLVGFDGVGFSGNSAYEDLPSVGSNVFPDGVSEKNSRVKPPLPKRNPDQPLQSSNGGYATVHGYGHGNKVMKNLESYRSESYFPADNPVRSGKINVASNDVHRALGANNPQRTKPSNLDYEMVDFANVDTYTGMSGAVGGKQSVNSGHIKSQRSAFLTHSSATNRNSVGFVNGHGYEDFSGAVGGKQSVNSGHIKSQRPPIPTRSLGVPAMHEAASGKTAFNKGPANRPPLPPKPVAVRGNVSDHIGNFESLPRQDSHPYGTTPVSGMLSWRKDVLSPYGFQNQPRLRFSVAASDVTNVSGTSFVSDAQHRANAMLDKASFFANSNPSQFDTSFSSRGGTDVQSRTNSSFEQDAYDLDNASNLEKPFPFRGGAGLYNLDDSQGFIDAGEFGVRGYQHNPDAVPARSALKTNVKSSMADWQKRIQDKKGHGSNDRGDSSFV